MSVAELERPVAKKQDTTLRADPETAEVIRKAASLKGISIADYLRSAFLPIARRDLSSEAKKIVKEDERQPKP